MDHELKQRLIGAVVVTALAAIFVPMLFDDPVTPSGKEVTEMTIPQPPSSTASETVQNLPQNKEQVLGKNEPDLKAVEVDDDDQMDTVSPEASPGIGSQPADKEVGANNPDAAIKPSQPIDNASKNSAVQDSAPGLDTGYTDGAGSTGNTPAQSSKPVEPSLVPIQESKAPVVAAPVKKKKPDVTDKPHTKIVKKTKPVEKSETSKSAKAGHKLVRYSIQAGSFNKKENAEAMVAKLRKQGLPATVTAKGDHFRVKVGPSLDKAKAKEMKAKLDKLSINGLLVSE